MAGSGVSPNTLANGEKGSKIPTRTINTVVIASGKLIAQGTLDELRHQAGRGGLTLEDTFLALVGQGAVAA